MSEQWKKGLRLLEVRTHHSTARPVLSTALRIHISAKKSRGILTSVLEKLWVGFDHWKVRDFKDDSWVNGETFPRVWTGFPVQFRILAIFWEESTNSGTGGGIQRSDWQQSEVFPREITHPSSQAALPAGPCSVGVKSGASSATW